MTDVTSAIAEVCAELTPPELGKREVRTTYVWDAGQNRYVPDSDAIDKLETENETRF